MSGRSLLAAGIAALVLLAPACGRRDAAPEPESPAGEAPSGAEDEPAAITPLSRTPVTLYFPSASSNALAGETREIFETSSPEDRAKQILSDLIEGPTDRCCLASLPPGTRVRQVYVLADGTAYVDFSSDLPGRIEGGSANEILVVYSVVDSLALNVPEISRVGILVEGRPCDTLNGHLDLRRPLPPDRDLIEARVRPAPRPEGDAPEEGSPVSPESGG